MVAAGQGDEAVERVILAHHIVEFRTVCGDGVCVTENHRNGYARMRARVTRRQIRGSGAQGGHVEKRAEGNPHELQQRVGLNGGAVNNRGEGSNRLVGGVRRGGFCARGGAGTLVRFEHGAQGDEVVVQGQAAQGE